MKSKRRAFLKTAGLTGAGIAGNVLLKKVALAAVPAFSEPPLKPAGMPFIKNETLNLIGPYGDWAASLTENKLPAFSFRRKEWSAVEAWKKTAKKQAELRLAIPDIGGTPVVTIKKQYDYDGLHIEEVSWQLPYGRPTDAIVLKPANVKGKLPGILAFHDHGGNKYLGTRKITQTSDIRPDFITEHQQHYYEGKAWANEVAKRGYVVMVSDAFPFASRRVMLQDVPVHLRENLTDDDPEKPENIEAYNKWASEHEHIMAKSLFSAGTTWPAVFFAEDRKALDVLCAREDVDKSRIGCGGLSGGGMRTAFMGGLDERIKCAVCVGFMTTWKDFLLNKSYTHTWMAYVPLLPNELDFPEILGLRVPLPTLVLNDSDDQLYTLPEMKRADGILREVYEKAKAADHYKCSYYPGVHKFDKQMQSEAFAWFDKWLK
jgi:dienelactone hydrolase